jgi:hypothetical protein
VINDTATPANNGVWQLIAGAEDWSYFSDNLDFVDEAELEAAITQEAADRNAALNAKLDKKTASGEYVYIHNGATQNEKAYTIAPTPSTIAERTSAGTLRGAAATDEADLVNYAQLQNSLKTTLADEAASDALPAATPSAFAGLLQKIRDNLKFLFGGLTLKVDKITGKGLSANDYTDDEKADAADILVRPTSLQTTDPPTYHVVRIDVTAGGAGYEAGDAVTASDPPVEAAVGAVDSDGAVTALSFNGQAVYDGNPAGADIAVSGGTGSGAVFSIRTAYAPGGVQKDGVLRHVPYGDPLVQTTRMKGYVKDYLESSSTARYAVQSEAMRRWTDSYLYSAGDITNFEGVWYTPKTDNMPIYGESPATHPEKWDKSPGGGLDDEAAFQIIKLQNKIDMLMREVFGDAGVQFKDHFDLDFYTLEGVSLETGVWNDAQGRVEV